MPNIDQALASSSWTERGRCRALEVFHQAADRVPAYRDFLRRRGVRPQAVQTYHDFLRLPVTDKPGYIDHYPLEMLVWDGRLSQNCMVHSSSGTTGRPYYWPCSAREMDDAASLYEQIYRDSFGLEDRPTLLMICFGMGTWIAGSYTHAASQLVSRKGHELCIATPGFNKEESLRILSDLAPAFRQTIIAGIPSFVKDLMDAYRAAGPLRAGSIRFLLAGEGFTERWRDHILALAGGGDVYRDAVSILGSADAGLIAHETPASIAIRRWAAEDDIVRHALFGTERLPALFNYATTRRFFEADGDELLLTADRALPLVRYQTHDQGGVLSFETIGQRAAQAGFSLEKKLTEEGLAGKDGLPQFVYVFGRGKLSATLYGANIYAETVQDSLLHDTLAPLLTGRFSLETKYDENFDQFLQIHVELAEHQRPEAGLAGRVADLFVETVRPRSSEYRRIWQEYGERAAPRVTLYPYGDRSLFPHDTIKKSS
jgi:phenylacetate-CoA ligase